MGHFVMKEGVNRHPREMGESAQPDHCIDGELEESNKCGESFVVSTAVFVMESTIVYRRIQEPENREAQYRVWADILTAYVLKEKVWSISIQECCMFVNRDINRMNLTVG